MVISGQQPASPIKNTQTQFSDPLNLHGNMILKHALTLSTDEMTMRLMEKISPENVMDIARVCGISSPLESVQPRGVPAAPVTPKEMAAAYATLASGGVHHDPFFIWRVEDALGHVIYEHLVQGKNVLDAATTFQVVDMMQAAVDKGAAKAVRQQGFSRPAAGKTGTAPDGYDVWFTGFTPGLSTAVWIGYDTPQKIETVDGTGITTGEAMAAVPIWTAFMSRSAEGGTCQTIHHT